jgi:hypothetical protein
MMTMPGLKQSFIDRQTGRSDKRFAFDTVRVFLLATLGAAAFLVDLSSVALRVVVAAAWVLVMLLLAATIVARLRYRGRR